MARSKITTTKNGPVSTSSAANTKYKELQAKLKAKNVKKGRVRRKKVKKIGKPHRFRPGTVAMREIRRYQKSTDPLLTKVAIRSLCLEIAGDMFADYAPKIEGKASITPRALRLLDESGEMYLHQVLWCAMQSAGKNKRITPMPRDMSLALELTSLHNPKF